MSLWSKAKSVGRISKIFWIKLLGNNLTADRTVNLKKCIISSKQGSIILGSYVSIMQNTTLEANEDGVVRLQGDNFINRNCVISAKKSIEIGEGTTIGPGTLIYDHDHDTQNKGKYICQPVTIGNNVWIGGGCIILKGVSIGDNAIVAAGTIVTTNVAPSAIRYNKIDPREKAIVHNMEIQQI